MHTIYKFHHLFSGGSRRLSFWQREQGDPGRACTPGAGSAGAHGVLAAARGGEGSKPGARLCPQILTCLLTEQRLVFFSASWALLPLVAACFLAYLHPLRWQHTLVPILPGQMLDFLMAPTAFLMGCHLRHFDEVSKVRRRWVPPGRGRGMLARGLWWVSVSWVADKTSPGGRARVL